MITVTYHLIAPPEATLLHPHLSINPTNLEKQIKHLAKWHNIISNKDLLTSLEKGYLPKNSTALTFDDAHRGQIEFALPILEKLNIKAYFFVPTCILEEKKLPIVEKQRLLQYAKINTYEDFYNRFCDQIYNFVPDLPEEIYRPFPTTVENALDYYAEYSFYTPLERLYRKIRNTMLTNQEFEMIIHLMFKDSFNESEIIEKYFLNWDDVQKIAELGHEVGGHGHAHLLETDVDTQVIHKDVSHALNLLNKKLNHPVKTYAYPYGIFSQFTEECLKKNNIKTAFTCKPGLGFEGSPLRIDRFDCQDFPFVENVAPNRWSLKESGKDIPFKKCVSFG